ncbi:type II CAAX prenyl endopeptidase Rce1 family protein [Butyrivibrio proteoclasticus]|uniref:CPBP family glutamic-type intramembrane protease n=1 Tax=Butyrivibrio proteoclasticus TaxID=43305 RepID=UPI00047A3881|nr:CPBP family glutamic-type intramembrane protease [Butyrivibrio proteoclasticus]
MNQKKVGIGNKIGTLILATLSMGALLGVQLVVSLVFQIYYAIEPAMKYGGDTEKYMEEYMAIIKDKLTMITFVAEIVCVAVFVLWYVLAFVNKDKKFNRYIPITKKMNPLSVVLLALVAFFTFSITNLLGYGTIALFPDAADKFSETMELALGNELNFFGVMSAAILAPICEDLAIRGVGLKMTRKHFTVVFCALISGILFGVMHLNIIQGIYVIPMGAIAGYICYKYDSVIPGIIIHMIDNTMSLFVPNLFPEEPPYLIFCAILLVVSGVAALLLAKKLTIKDLKYGVILTSDGTYLPGHEPIMPIPVYVQNQMPIQGQMPAGVQYQAPMQNPVYVQGQVPVQNQPYVQGQPPVQNFTNNNQQ